MIWLLWGHNLVSKREKLEQVIFAFQLERHFFCVIRVCNFHCGFYANLLSRH